MTFQGSTFKEADEYLGAKEERPAANNTRLIRRGDDIALRLHSTDVVTYHVDGTATLQTGGWYSVTTKERMNTFSPARIGSKKGRWFLFGPWHQEPRQEWPFVDGMRVDDIGLPVDRPNLRQTVAEQKREDRAISAIRKYASDFVEALKAGKIPQPGNGDCWFCLFKDSKTGETWGDSRTSDALPVDVRSRAAAFDHLASHVKEQYYVPSLLVNAVKEKGANPSYWIASDDADHLGMGIFTNDRDGWHSRQLRSAIVRYMARRLVPARTVR